MNAIKFVTIAILLAVVAGPASAQTTTKIILVSDNEADNAVAVTVGSLKGFEVVTTPWGEYDSAVVENIKGLNPGEVIIIGGPAAVPSKYETALLEFTNTIRVAGKDRYATVARVLELFKEDFKGKKAVAAYGYDKKGIEKALEKARAQGLVVVFVERSGVPWEVQKALENAGVSSLIVEEAPDMDTEEIMNDVKDDVGSVSIVQVDHSIRVAEQIQEAREEILKAQNAIDQLNVTATAPLRLLDNAKEHLADAEEAYNEGRYGRAFGLAVSAEQLAENAKEIAEELEEFLEETKGRQEEVAEKIAEEIQDLREEITEEEAKASRAEARGINVTEVRIYLSEAASVLDKADAALSEGDTAKAVAELRNSRNLLAHAEVTLDRKEDTYGKPEERELEVEVKIKGGVSLVKVEINDEKTQFRLQTADRAEILEEIIKRTGLSEEEVKAVIEYEEEKEEIEIEVEIEGDVAKVEVEIGSSKQEFVLNTTDRGEIISLIVERTGLTMEQVEANIKFEGNHAKLGEQRIKKEEEKAEEDEEEKDEEEKEEFKGRAGERRD